MLLSSLICPLLSNFVFSLIFGLVYFQLSGLSALLYGLPVWFGIMSVLVYPLLSGLV